MSALQAHAFKEKKALEEAYEEGFNVIFNCGYGCCAFVHNICGSQPVVPNRMPDTSKPLIPEFFINPRYPPSIDVRSGEVMIASEREVPAAILEADISEAGEHIPTA